jgi:glyoxylase-like metal-dependent hydrolase (beta-lactamase superfamily II)
MAGLTRRQALVATAAMPVAAGLGSGAAMAAAEMKGMSSARTNSFMLGDFEVTTLLGGTATRDEPQGTFGMNVSPEEFAEVSARNFIPVDKTQFFFTPTLVNTGPELILFDTGLNPEATVAVLAEAGYAPGEVDTVVITHMHGDHVGGLSTDGTPTFGNARIITGAVEHNHWAAAGNETFDTKVAPLNDRISFLDDGGSVASGISAMAAFGHTPGHMGYMLESNGQQLMLFADMANHYVWSLAYPDWEVRFDMDKTAAAETRRRILGMLAADRIPAVGYHMPFPAMGYVATRGDGFQYVPVSYQMMMG